MEKIHNSMTFKSEAVTGTKSGNKYFFYLQKENFDHPHLDEFSMKISGCVVKSGKS
ncbi:hypothetical protein NIES4074_47860 [Cylindrospermum sp. NIES-4074]|nr:hypothetical protein NIES4074_47860 [Cylindrospermum sp. NIES-4074]